MKVPDLTGKHCRETGEILAPPTQHPSLPAGTLPDQAAKEKFVKETEGLIDKELNIAPNLIKNPGPAAQQVKAGSPLNAVAEANLGNRGPNVAAGMAMRYYAGFFDMAKALRYEENADAGGATVIDDAMRAAYMADIHGKAQKDAIYAAGAKFGWWGVKRPDRPIPENVFDNGISAFYKQEYLADYYRLYPPPAGATPCGS
jgi:hypothetical protein